MRLSERLIVSDPERESEWRQVLLRKLTKPELYVITIPEERSYPAEIMTSKEYYKVESNHSVLGIADSYGAAVALFRTAVEAVVLQDPSLRQLKAKLREIYL